MSRKVFTMLRSIVKSTLWIGLLLTTGILAVFAREGGESNNTFVQEVVPSHKSVYFNAFFNRLVSTEELDAKNVTVVYTYAQLIATVDDSVEIVYLHPDTVNAVDPAWLRRAYYEKNLVIVAFDTPISVITSILGTEATVDDLRPEFAGDRLMVAAVQLLNEKGLVSRTQFSDYSDNFITTSSIIENNFLDIDYLDKNGNDEASIMAINGSWPHNGDTLRGSILPSSSGGFYYYKAISTYPPSAFHLAARVKITTWCDYQHVLIDKYVAASNVTTINTGNQLAGSNQCPTSVRADGTHEVRRYSPNTMTTGYTDVTKTIPGSW